MHALIWAATRGVMEILGLVPCQSQTQYLQPIFQIGWRGNMVEKYFHYISSSFPLPVVLTLIVEIWRKYISTSESHIINGAKNCNARETPSIDSDSL
jgi:hypothetical protein